jgi:hypothetical protein
MNRKELEYVKKILEHIKDSDQHIAKALAYVNKDLAQYDACKGQLREMYEYNDYGF